jgi:simple sugar transport system ATP-binding protein
MNLEENVSGSIQLLNEELVGRSVHQTIHAGVAYIPESRELDGLIGSFSIAENLILDTHDLAPFSKLGQLTASRITENATKLKSEFDIRAQSISDTANSLSGGNKQKVVLARELSRDVKLVVASQPTRGLDVGSIEFVHERLLAEKRSGRAVLLVSTELDEVIALADRIAVIYRGEILGIVDSNVSREKLGLMMAGVK